MTDIGLFSLDKDSNVVFSFKNIERVVSGPEEALQVVAYHLFTSPGTNSYDKDDGGDMQSLIKGHFKSEDEINTDATIIVNRALSNIKRTQSQNKSADATITGLKLLSANVLKDSLEIQLRIRIELLDGNSFQATFRTT